MDHYYECDGVQYRLSLVVPLNQTHRTTEPNFEFKCKELSQFWKIILGAVGGILALGFIIMYYNDMISSCRRRLRKRKLAMRPKEPILAGLDLDEAFTAPMDSTVTVPSFVDTMPDRDQRQHQDTRMVSKAPPCRVPKLPSSSTSHALSTKLSLSSQQNYSTYAVVEGTERDKFDHAATADSPPSYTARVS